MKSWFRLLLVVGVSAAFVGCGQGIDSSATKSVEIPQTPVKSQNQVGFCWAYATTGFLESLMLKKNGQSVDLSEEAIGYYRMAEELVALSRKYTAEELATAELVEEKTFEGLEG